MQSSLTDDLCSSLPKEEQQMCYEFAMDVQEIIKDLDSRGHLRSKLEIRQREEKRKDFMNVLWSVRKAGHAFNMFFDMRD